MDTLRLSVPVLVVALALAGCSSEARRAAEAVCDGSHGGPEHCPGAPCLGCHGSQFALAGTIYASPTDRTGLQGAVVTFVDADGTSYMAATNAAGNFMVEVTGDPATAGAYSSGRLLVATAPRFPIASVSVIAPSDPPAVPTMLTMASPIHRDGSCATCHILADTTGSAAGPGRVFATPQVVP